MSGVVVVTDTDSSLSSAVAEKYGIILVPITIHFGEESFITGETMDDRQLFERIDREGALPTTAAPSPAAFVEAYRKAFARGADAIFTVCISGTMSNTVNAAQVAAEEFPGRSIRVLDSTTLSMCQGFIAIEAAKAAAKGAKLDAIETLARSMMKRTVIYGSLTTLKYIAMSGRVGKLAAGMAGMLSIRPILTSIDGKLSMLEKIRTKKGAMDRLVELVVKASEGRTIQLAAVIHAVNEPDAAALEAALREKLALPKEVPHFEFTPGLSVHTGSGLIGVTLILDE
ncbi:MAG TPA: DegV family protein [Longilinea sp.]|nr:DegV family protein [Longilinea sp.]